MLVRPRRVEGESTIGHVLRVADRNGLARPGWLLDELGFTAHGQVRICPRCLGEPDALWLTCWEAALPGWCSKHGVWLVDSCRNCGKRLNWRHVRLLTCTCGYALSANDALPVNAQTRAAIERGLAPPSVLLWLGTLERYGLQGKPLKKATRHDMRSAVVHLNRGAHIAAEWPASAIALLNRIRMENSRSMQVQLVSQAFPGLLKLVHRLDDEAWRGKLHDALASYMACSLSTTTPLLSRSPEVHARRRGSTRTALELGIGTRRLKRLLEECSLQVPKRRTCSGRICLVVQDSALARLRSQMTERKSLRDAGKLLGVTPERVQQLAESGLLPRTGSSFIRASVLALAVALKQGPRCDIGESDEGVPLSRALQCLVPLERTGELFKAIQDREIALGGDFSKPGLRGLVVDLVTLRSWLSRPGPAEGRYLTLPQAAGELGLKQQVVYDLARHELLPTRLLRVNRRRARVVSPQTLADFRRNFTALSAVARERGWPNKHSFERATQSGLDVVTGPSIDGARQYFVRISVDTVQLRTEQR